MRNRPIYLCAVALVRCWQLTTACRQDMQDQPRYKPLAESDFFSDHRSARPQVEGTVARGHLRIDEARYTGKIDGEDIDQFPIPIAKADIERGQTRFNIYCTPCHGRLGDGNGMVVLRGFRQPPSYYSDRLMNAPVGHFFDVITNGFGAMPSYASRVQSGRPLARHCLHPRAAVERIRELERRAPGSAPESDRGAAAARHPEPREPPAGPQGGNQ